MLSISAIKSSSTAGHYFEKDNYYAKDSPESRDASEWWGKGAEILNLKDHVDIDSFVNLLDGKLPNGQQLGVTKNGKIHHRHGYDLTFSAPKSVSLLLKFGNDKRLFDAHNQAVNKTLALIESELANTRIQKNGKIQFQSTANLAIAKFHHDTSRALDPQVHTHAVVLNITQGADSKFRSLGSQTEASIKTEGLQGFSEQLYHRKKTYGMIYRAELAEAVKDLGYEIVKTSQDGCFEIAGVSNDIIKAFSKRREQITSAMGDLGFSGGKQAAYATLLTRSQKQSLTRGELKSYWQSESEGLNLKSIVHEAKAKTVSSLSPIEKEALAQKSLNFAIYHLSERNSVFSKDDLLKTTLQQGLGQINVSNINDVITKISEEKTHLLSLPIHKNTQYYTTPSILKLEKENITLMQAGKSQTRPILSTEKTNFALGEYSLTKGQFDAASMILTTKNKICGVQGYAGTGKTTLLKSVKTIAEKEGYILIGICPTTAAANKLANETGMKSQTLASFLLESKTPNNASKTLLIVDEASMASAKSANALLKVNQKSNSRIVLLGDIQQLASVEAGKPFEQLQQAGMQTAIMKDIVRQKDGSAMKAAVYAAIVGHIPKALANLTEIKEIPSKHERLDAIAAHYLSLSPEERSQTLLITPANEDRRLMNSKVREGLQGTGEIDNAERFIQVLQNKGLTQAEKMRVTHYALDDTIRFNKTAKSLGLQAGEYYQVKQIDKETNTLSLLSKKGKTIEWQPHRFGSRSQGVVEVFQSVEIPISKGETLRFTRNIKSDGLINSEKAQVLDFKKSTITIKLANDKIVKLDSNNPQHRHLDYGYALTTHAAQGESYKQVIAHDESFREKLTNQKAFYVIISRAKEAVYLYTDDKAHYQRQLETHTGEKLAALDLLSKEYATSVVLDEKTKDTPTLNNSSLESEVNIEKANPEIRNAKSSTPVQNNIKNFDFESVYREAVLNIESVVQSLLGEPNRKFSNQREWRYGSKGAFSIGIKGEYAGVWHDFESGQKGNIIQLVQREMGCDYKTAIEITAKHLNIQPDFENHYQDRSLRDDKIKGAESKLPNTEDLQKIAVAQKIWSQAKPIDGTLAETFLREYRGITVDKLPDTLRFHENYFHPIEKQYYPALIAVAQTKDNEIHAVQAICLDKETGQKANIDLVKITHGRMSFCAGVYLGDPNSQKMYIAEGVETALSLLSADPTANAVATLSKSNFDNLELAPQREIILCADNDKGATETYQSLQDNLSHLSQFSESLKIVTSEQEKSDFNDVLRTQGTEVIQLILENAQSYCEPEKTATKDKSPLNHSQLLGNFLNYNHQQLSTIEKIFSDTGNNGLAFLSEKKSLETEFENGL